MNALRGDGKIPKYGCAAGMAIVLYFCSALPLIYIPILTLLLWAGLAPGWGKYFGVFDGSLASYNETEVKIIDKITDKIVSNSTSSYRLWCFVATSIRGLCFYPVFIALSFYDAYALLYGLGVLLMGCIYLLGGYAPAKYRVRCSEFGYGALLGLLLTLSVGN